MLFGPRRQSKQIIWPSQSFTSEDDMDVHLMDQMMDQICKFDILV